MTATVTVTNHGPTAAGPLRVTVPTLGAGAITGAGGGTAAEASTCSPPTASPPRGPRRSPSPLTTPSAFSIGAVLVYAESPTPDPDLFNNFGLAPIITS